MVAMTIISKTQEYHNLSMISWGGEKGNLNTASKKHVRTDDMQWVAYCSATDTIDRARINGKQLPAHQHSVSRLYRAYSPWRSAGSSTKQAHSPIA